MAPSSLPELATVTHFELHALPRTLPYECHPNFSYITHETNRQVIESLGVGADSASRMELVQSRMGMLGSLLIPRGEDEHRMILASKNILALFVVDDVFESHPQQARHLIETLVADLHNPTPDAGVRFQTYPRPWLLVQETTQQLRNEMSSSLFLRYRSSFTTFLLGVLDEVENHQAKNFIPSVETYGNLRRKNVFTYGSSILVGEFCMGIDFEKEVFESLDYIDLCNAIVDHTALVNDLMSFRKEFFSDVHFNWVYVLMNEGKSLQQAIDAIYKMIHEAEDKILELQKNLIKRANATKNMDLLKFANACPLVASGNVYWSFITGRYHGYNNPLISGELFQGTCLLHPKATIVLQLDNCQYTHPLLVVE